MDLGNSETRPRTLGLERRGAGREASNYLGEGGRTGKKASTTLGREGRRGRRHQTTLSREVDKGGDIRPGKKWDKAENVRP